MDQSWWRVLTKRGSLGKGECPLVFHFTIETTLVFLPWEPREQYEKAKRYDSAGLRARLLLSLGRLGLGVPSWDTPQSEAW